MSTRFVYPALASSLDEALDFARCGAALSESEATLQSIAHSSLIENINGFSVWYCYGADHYFFTDTE